MMELPQSRAAFGGEGRKPTHDFLSLCSHSNLHQDPRPPSQGNLLQTHDFLGKTSGKEETSKETSSGEKLPPPVPSPLVEHLLPGGIGTYSISHISYYNNLGGPVKPEAVGFTAAQSSSNTERNDENSNCSSYTNSGFTLWEESATKKGKTGKENLHAVAVKEPVVKLGQWTSSERPSISSSNNNLRSSFSPLSSSQPVGQKNQRFMDMFKSAKGASSSHEEELDDEDEFMIKKENSPAPKGGDLRLQVDGKSGDQKANTPRSKHSATEQRRRSKINDRFQTLRTLIPQSDQKRDKASFLLEVIEYVQYLQEKVHKFEGTYQGFNYDQAKMVSWRNGQRPSIAEAYADQSRGATSGTAPGLVFPTKFEENNVPMSPAILRSMKNNQEVDIACASGSSTLKGQDHQLGVTANKTVPFPVSLQQNMPTPPVSGLGISQRPDLEIKAPQPSSLTNQTKPWPNDGASSLNDKLKEQELDVEGGTISISSAYSKGLLNTLTQALQSSGVDLSEASISVQIDLGKRANSKPATPAPTRKDGRAGTTRPRVEGNDSDHHMHQSLKKMKTGKS